MAVIQIVSTVISTSHLLVELLETGHLDTNSDPKADLAGLSMTLAAGEEDTYSAESLAAAGTILSLAVVTKNHLLELYSLAEDKCLKATIGKKSALGDKPATSKGALGLDLHRVPFVRGVRTVEDFEILRRAVSDISEDFTWPRF